MKETCNRCGKPLTEDDLAQNDGSGRCALCRGPNPDDGPPFLPLDPPTRDELALWRSRCAPMSGDWRDVALMRCISSIEDRPPSGPPRIERIAVALMPGILANRVWGQEGPATVAASAIRMAEALIEKLDTHEP